MNDNLRTVVFILNGLFCAVALALAALGVSAYSAAKRTATRRARWMAVCCGVLLSGAAVAALAMAFTLNGEREPLWLVTTWFLAGIGLLVIAARDFVAGSRSSRSRVGRV